MKTVWQRYINWPMRSEADPTVCLQLQEFFIRPKLHRSVADAGADKRFRVRVAADVSWCYGQMKNGGIFFLLVSCLLVTSTGCAPFNTVRTDGTVVRHYFGYTRIVIPAHQSTEGDFGVMELSSSGARLWPSLGFGYFHERDEYIPLDSRIVIKVQNQQQLDQVIKTLGPIAKDGLCVTTEK